ncbi:hypothetical protein [Winogradskyella sp.]|uniref:hypothetical protein n=1 Tax=Winogradskyella sp. TaxID=1883156 RepID=UPI003F6C7272
MRLYYDGLMKAVNKDKDFTVPKTIIAFNETTKDNAILPSFIGSIKVYDSFFSRKVITLNVSVETSYCENENKYLMLFRVSTLEFENDIWIELNNIKLIDNVCEVKS